MRIGLLLLAAALVLAPLASGAAYLKLGDIKGEATDSAADPTGEARADDIASWSIRLMRDGDQVHVQDMSLVKELDKSSPKLMQSIALGQHMPEVHVGVVDAAGHEYFAFKLEEAIVSSYTISGAGDDRPTEEVSFNFAKVEFHYQEQDAAAGPQVITFTGLE